MAVMTKLGGVRGAVWRRGARVFSILAAALVFLAAKQALASEPEFKIVADTPAGGRALTSSFPAASAQVAFRAAFDALAHRWGAKPVLQSAVGNSSGDVIQGFFRGTNQGTAIRGVITASAQGGNAGVAVLFEHADSYPQALPGLAKQLAAHTAAASGGPAAPAPLTPTTLSDGGEIGLPAGWRVSGTGNGAVDVTNGASSISLGVAFHVMIRGSGRGIHGPYRPPLPALESVVDLNTRGGVGRGEVTVKVVEQLPPPSGFDGEAARMIVDIITQGGNTTRALALVATSRTNADQWYLYVSMATAPIARFDAELPTLRAIWHSWKLSPKVVHDRVVSIRHNQHEIADMKRSSIALKTRASAIGALGADQYLRDQETIGNVNTGWKGDCDSHYSQKVVDLLNKAGGNYRIVPPSELVP